DNYAAVVRFEREVGLEGHEDFVSNLPVVVVVALRSLCVNLRACGLHANLRGKLVCLFLRGRVRLNSVANENLIALPTFHCHAAVLTSIHVDGAACRRKSLFFNLAMCLAVTVNAIVVARERASLTFTPLGQCG